MGIEYKIFFGVLFSFTVLGIFISLHFCGIAEDSGNKEKAIGLGFLSFFFFFISFYTGFFFLMSLSV